MHEKDDQLTRQSSSSNIAQSFSETDTLLMIQPNNTSSPMPTKNQTLNGKEVLLKHIGHLFHMIHLLKGISGYLMVGNLKRLNVKQKQHRQVLMTYF